MKILNLSKLNFIHIKNKIKPKKNQKETLPPKTEQFEANYLDMASNYNKGAAKVLKNQTQAKKRETLSQMTTWDNKGNKKPLFSDKDIEDILKDEQLFNYVLRLAKITYTDLKGRERRTFSDGREIKKIAGYMKASDRLLKFADIVYTDCDGEEQRVFTDKDDLILITNNHKIIPDEEFKERVIRLADITYFDQFGHEKRVFEDLDIANIASDKNIEINDEFIEKINNFCEKYQDEYYIKIKKSQNESDLLFSAEKKGVSKDNPQNACGKDYIAIVKSITKTLNGEEIKSTIYRDSIGNEESWIMGGDRELIINKKTGKTYREQLGDEYLRANRPALDINYQIEIIKDKNGEPKKAIYTKASDKLQGAYIVKKYNFADYPCDMDVISAIKDGTITGGVELSTVKSKNGKTLYLENYKRNGKTTKRAYFQKTDSEGNVVSTGFKYVISNEAGRTLLSTERSWVKNQDNTTTSVIDGKKYIAKFYDRKKKIEIIEDGSKDIKATINLNGSEEEVMKEFFNFLKTLPADELIVLDSSVSKIYITDNLKSNIDSKNKTLYIGFDSATLHHELGHSIDFDESDTKNSHGISENKELIDIYNKEMNKFKREYPAEAQNLIRYFSQTGGGVSTGLSELTAEVNILLKTYGNEQEMIQTRANYLVKYFPETVAKAGELLLKGIRNKL